MIGAGLLACAGFAAEPYSTDGKTVIREARSADGMILLMGMEIDSHPMVLRVAYIPEGGTVGGRVRGKVEKVYKGEGVQQGDQVLFFPVAPGQSAGKSAEVYLLASRMRATGEGEYELDDCVVIAIASSPQYRELPQNSFYNAMWHRNLIKE